MKKKVMLHAVATDKPLQGSNLVKKDKEWFIAATPLTTDMIPYHLYLSSSEEIKGQGLRLDLDRMSVGVIDDDNYYNNPKNGNFRKIVATSNLDLHNKGYAGVTILNIAKIPQSLVKYFVEKQGKVDTVMVEYESGEFGTWPTGDEPRIKLNQSGEIIWSPIEEKMYTRDELNDAILQASAFILSNVKVASFGIDAPSVNQVQGWFNKMYPE